MITQELALTTADAWLNSGADTAGLPRREVRHREFELGWVVWAAPAPLERDPVTGQRRPPADLGAACGVVDRATGELSVWSSIPVDEVIDAYRESKRPSTGPGNSLTADYTDPATGQPARIEITAGSGRPPVEHQLLGELLRRGVAPEAVTAVHTALCPSTLPGGYPAVALERLPNAAFSHDFPYGITADERAQGIAGLTARLRPTPRPNRAPAPLPGSVEPAEPVRDVALGRQLPAALGLVTRYDADDLASSALPESTRSTLAWAGLPTEVPLLFTADQPAEPAPGGLFADLRTHLTATGSPIAPATLDVLAGWTRIGTDGLCVIAVQTAGDEAGSVWAVHPRTGSGRFVNTTVSAFDRSLALLTTERPKLAGLAPAQAGAALAALQDGLAAIDPDTFRKDTTWWSVIVEQMWHGLF
ncbi:SUKH-4 family immunity protein [Kitasatospora sp. NPDC096147]|uniref:SUKH-4 family immunity protein n=1 Tax=Kitasatospora sp. NPDC096147 TaxID=3364093 RepID=UPI003821B68B